MTALQTRAGGLSPRSYWASGQGLGNITPAGNSWSEGQEFVGVISKMFAGEHLLEFGCGVGRLAPCFDAGLYVGVDICPQAIEIAMRMRPGYRFQIIDGELPESDAILSHTVTLHIGDDELPETISQFRARKVVVSEVLGRHWRRDGLPPVFNREAEDYIRAFRGCGYVLSDRLDIPYTRYRDTNLTMLTFERRPCSG